MFVKAIDDVLKFTRPIHTIARYWDREKIEPGAATLFFINDQGWALTCQHVARLLFAGINRRFRDFKAARDSLEGGKKSRSAINKIAEKFGYKKGALQEIHCRFYGCIDGQLDLEARLHPSLDVALLKFKNYTTLLCDEFPIFAKQGSELKPGKYICRVGYPFPEFTNFELDKQGDELRWTAVGRQDTPFFPIEAMVTRRLIDGGGGVIGFELSTPGLKGQSGGPAFDADARVWGMGAATRHLDLQFDVNEDVFRSGQKVHVTEHAFLHVGDCVHVDILKDFMRKNSVDFVEG
jgi:hypothetical protein